MAKAHQAGTRHQAQGGGSTGADEAGQDQAGLVGGAGVVGEAVGDESLTPGPIEMAARLDRLEEAVASLQQMTIADDGWMKRIDESLAKITSEQEKLLQAVASVSVRDDSFETAIGSLGQRIDMHRDRLARLETAGLPAGAAVATENPLPRAEQARPLTQREQIRESMAAKERAKPS
jgi:hypothetical protein